MLEKSVNNMNDRTSVVFGEASSFASDQQHRLSASIFPSDDPFDHAALTIQIHASLVGNNHGTSEPKKKTSDELSCRDETEVEGTGMFDLAWSAMKKD